MLVGTLYPLVVESISGHKISVGAPFFDLTFGIVMVPLLFAMPFGPLLAWKRGDVAGVAQRLLVAGLVGIVVMAITYGVYFGGPVLAPFAIGLGAFVMMGALSDIAWRSRLGSVGFSEALRRAWNLPRSAWGGAIAHFGIGLMVVGVVATSAYRVENILVLKPNETTSIAGYDVTFKGEAPRKGPNYREQVGVVDVTRGGVAVTRLYPAKRVYQAPPQETTEAGIHASWAGDLYTVLGDRQRDGGFTFRLYFNPLVRFIWLGALIMFFGGAISLADRRLRVGAPVRARRDGGDALAAAE